MNEAKSPVLDNSNAQVNLAVSLGFPLIDMSKDNEHYVKFAAMSPEEQSKFAMEEFFSAYGEKGQPHMFSGDRGNTIIADDITYRDVYDCLVKGFLVDVQNKQVTAVSVDHLSDGAPVTMANVLHATMENSEHLFDPVNVTGYAMRLLELISKQKKEKQKNMSADARISQLWEKVNNFSSEEIAANKVNLTQNHQTDAEVNRLQEALKTVAETTDAGGLSCCGSEAFLEGINAAAVKDIMDVNNPIIGATADMSAYAGKSSIPVKKVDIEETLSKSGLGAIPTESVSEEFVRRVAQNNAEWGYAIAENKINIGATLAAENTYPISGCIETDTPVHAELTTESRANAGSFDKIMDEMADAGLDTAGIRGDNHHVDGVHIFTAPVTCKDMSKPDETPKYEYTNVFVNGDCVYTYAPGLYQTGENPVGKNIFRLSTAQIEPRLVGEFDTISEMLEYVAAHPSKDRYSNLDADGKETNDWLCISEMYTNILGTDLCAGKDIPNYEEFTKKDLSAIPCFDKFGSTSTEAAFLPEEDTNIRI